MARKLKCPIDGCSWSRPVFLHRRQQFTALRDHVEDDHPEAFEMICQAVAHDPNINDFGYAAEDEPIVQ